MLGLKHSRAWEVKEEFGLTPAQRKAGKEHRKEIILSSNGDGVSFITLGPATLKDNICIGEEERTKDTLLLFGMKSYFLLFPNTVLQAYLLMDFNKPWSYFTH